MPRHKRTAVARNRVKRRLRELLRTALLPQLATRADAVDLVVRASPEAYSATFTALAGDVTRIVRRFTSAP